MEKRWIGEERRTSMQQQSYAMSEALVFLFGGLNALAIFGPISEDLGRRWLSSLGLRFNRAAVHQWKSTLFAVPFFVVLKLQTLQTFKGRCMKDIFQISWDILGHATEFSDVRLEVLE